METTKSILLALSWDDEASELVLLDQRLLPLEVSYIRCRTLESVRDAICTMAVRGAPAIGVAAAYGVAMGALRAPDDCLVGVLADRAAWLASARPTAVNLSWAVSRMMARARGERGATLKGIRATLLDEAKAIHREDTVSCRRIGEALLPCLRDGMGILTHCNAGQLATSRYGTALSPIYLGMEKGMHFRVYADETRPRLQGSMLTAFELQAAGADVTVLCDNMAASVMERGMIDCCIVGCDRVAKNGDTANKIGTFGVAVLAKHFGIPFYVAAPFST
ncbi:MAG: S-methyl-5-thioribose-1-phosphate isomerase, partial [Clostridia bacterium]|nr:S-methyl-5-thioribose-1-phosphate isomerase [Clostridia bacterium]